MDVLTWELASTSVTDQIALLITMSDYRQSCVALALRATLTLADAMVLVRHLYQNSSCPGGNHWG